MSAETVQQEIIEEFSFFEDWTEKYEYIIELGKELPALASEHKVQENIVRGCQSHVWLHASYSDGILHFEAESEALIVRGLVAMLMRVYNHQTPQQILDTQPHFIDAIEMSAHLSPTRSNGLASMVKHIKAYALAYKTKEENSVNE